MALRDVPDYRPDPPEAAGPPQSVSLVAYDRQAAYGLLRDGTPAQLRADLLAGRFGARLAPAGQAELEALLTAWVQRALGPMSLRDAMLVDRHRGERVFALICGALTRASAPVEPALAAGLGPAGDELPTLPAPLAAAPELQALGRLAAEKSLALALLREGEGFPLPADLDALTPPAPTPLRRPEPPFEQPTGWRRRIAVLLATGGVALLVLPVLVGQIPDHPAGVPLALLTLALLIGIKAGPAGYAGSLCIWLVANLPGFRHGSSLLSILWPALPLMGVGLGLLSLDRRVRTMWGWLRRQLGWGS